MQFGWTKVYYDPETMKIIRERIPDEQVYVGLDRGSRDFNADLERTVQPDGSVQVTAIRTWRHEIDLVANKEDN